MAILRDYCDSELVNFLSQGAENLFTRLLCKCDDFGNITSDPVLIKAYCFPRKNYRLANISDWIKELSATHHVGTSNKPTSLVRIYQVSGKQYIHIPNFGCEKKYKKRIYPPPNEVDIEEEAEVETEIENARAVKNFYLRGRLINQNAGDWLREKYEARIDEDFMTKFRTINRDEMLTEFTKEAFLMDYREEGHIFNSFKKFCEKKINSSNNGNKFNRKGQPETAAIVGTAQQILRNIAREQHPGGNSE